MEHTEKLDPNMFPDQTVTIVLKHKGKVFAKGMQVYLGSGAEVEQALMNLEHISKLVYNHILYKLAREVAPLRVDQLEKLPADKIFAAGTFQDNEDDVHFTGTGDELRWLAKTGGNADWAIYVGRLKDSLEEIAKSGDKMTGEENIKKLLNCTDEAFAKYRM